MTNERQSSAPGWNQASSEQVGCALAQNRSSNAPPSISESADDPASHSVVLPWLLEASNPYWDWLWGSPEESRTQLTQWFLRPSSELWENRLVCLRDNDCILGGYIGLSGSELRMYRKADLLALMDFLRRNPSVTLMARLRQARSLFATVADDEFYLSRIGVAASFRGRGAGIRLMEMFLQNGRNRGFKRFRLDVSTTNTQAIRLYDSLGFKVTSDSAIAETHIRYSSMLACFP